MMHNSKDLLNRIFSAIEPENIIPGQNGKKLTLDLYYINNPDGTPRWIWPAGLAAPSFLKFYNISNSRSKLIAGMIRLAFAMKMQKTIISGRISISVEETSLTAIEKITGSQWSLFTGTAGLNRTALFYGNNRFCKVPVGENASSILEKEYRTLNKATISRSDTLEMPSVQQKNGMLVSSDVSNSGKRISVLTPLHCSVIGEISENNKSFQAIRDSGFWKELDSSLSKLLGSPDQRLPKGLIRKLDMLKRSIDINALIPVNMAHGDFTPWNIFVKEKRIGLIDWELSNEAMPCLYDVFHFIHQQASLVDHNTYSKTKEKLKAAISDPSIQELVAERSVDADLHHKLYLLITSAYYLGHYEQQENWHAQVQMSFDYWNCVVDDLMAYDQSYSMRSAFILSLTDQLRNKDYAALKLLQEDLSRLPEYSDIDLCADRATSHYIDKYISAHPQVSQVKKMQKSFMTNYSILFRDDSFLSIDAIRSFMRKDLMILDSNALLKSASLNSSGVKVPSPGYDLQYITLFYLLNHSTIPTKYAEHYKLYANQLPLLNGQNRSDILRKHLDAQKHDPDLREEAEKILRSRPANRGINSLINSIHYFIDCVKESFFRKGFIITFSGVDGAGKSTVIENVKQLIEKKYRRKVVVLRHRPALLPMLTAWKHGKEVAEQQAALRLPRQGNNKSTISSLLRFGYYYADYLLGQFMVHFKYVSRGYVVLYDRYYFDFINDGKRSNILLPDWFTKFWYTFLLKPSYNFFLYADAETILKRKKELDATTITLLTQRYLSLFNRFSRKFPGSSYIPVKNEQLTLTMDLILQTIKSKSI